MIRSEERKLEIELLKNNITNLSLLELVQKMSEFNGLPRDRMLDFDKEDIVTRMGYKTNAWEAYQNYIDYKLS